MRSLRARVLLGAGLLAALLVATSLLVTRQITFNRFEEFVVAGQIDAAARAADLVAQAVAQAVPPPDLPAIASAAHAATGAMILVVGDGRVVAAAPVSPAAVRIVSEQEALRIEMTDGDRRATYLLKGTPGRTLVDATGNTVGQVLTMRPLQAGGPSRQFGSDLTRRFLLTAAMIGAACVVLLWFGVDRVVRPVETLTAAARRLAAGELGHRVALDSRDEVGELGRAFNAMAESLERNETLRRSLLNDVAHELRTPLTHLRAELEAMQDGLGTPSRDVIDRLHADTVALERLVDDLRDVAEAEAGQLQLTPLSIPVDPELEHAASTVAAVAARGGVRVDVRPSGATVRADRARLRQMLINLVDNAVRHARSRVTLDARAVNGQVEVRVTDDGPGVGPDHLPHLFERFYRVDPSRDRRTGGTGLGLAIVKHLAVAQGGDVSAEKVDEGMVVSFRLPADRGSAGAGLQSESR